MTEAQREEIIRTTQWRIHPNGDDWFWIYSRGIRNTSDYCELTLSWAYDRCRISYWVDVNKFGVQVDLRKKLQEETVIAGYNVSFPTQNRGDNRGYVCHLVIDGVTHANFYDRRESIIQVCNDIKRWFQDNGYLDSNYLGRIEAIEIENLKGEEKMNAKPILEQIKGIEMFNRLKGSLLFYMSLGSKELFHSNTWGWLIENNNSFARLFFPSIPQGAIVTVTREERKRDLTIWINKGAKTAKAYVIENKFKSIPRKEQLLEYERNVGSRFAEGVVTGIEKPHWIEEKGVSRWRFMSYPEISAAIRKEIGSMICLSEPYKELIKDYCTMIEDMSELLDKFLEPYPDTLLTMKQCFALSDVRLEDLVNKLSAERFANWLREQLEMYDIERRVSESGLKFTISTDYLKKHSIIDIRIVGDSRSDDVDIKNHDGTSQWLLGIQIEDGVYSRCFQVGGQIKKSDGRGWRHGEIFKKFNELGWLPSKENVTNAKKVRVPYGRYEVHGKYSFVYQPEGLSDMSYSTLKNKIVSDMNAACDFIEKVDIKKELTK